VAEHLVDAGFGLFQGGIPPQPGWLQIVHRDYKLRNVFLATRNPFRYPEYPELLLGDFGLAFITAVNDVNNPDFYLGVTTERWTAPEQLTWMDSTTHNRIDVRRILDPANVFGTGLILYCLAMRNADPPAALVSVSLECRLSYVLTHVTLVARRRCDQTPRMTYLQQGFTATN
jgi:serine/threonine protein kinase